MAVGENPLKFLLLKPILPPACQKSGDWVEKHRNGTTFLKSNCPTQEYMTGPLKVYYCIMPLIFRKNHTNNNHNAGTILAVANWKSEVTPPCPVLPISTVFWQSFYDSPHELYLYHLVNTSLY